MYGVPVGACVFPVVPWFFDVFPPDVCLGVFLLVRFLCLILLRMSCGRSLSVLRILPTGMCLFPAWYSMLVNVLFASCMSVGGCSAEKASSVSCVNLSQSPFL